MPADPAWNHLATLLADVTLAGFAVWAACALINWALRRGARRAHPDHPQYRPRSHVRRLTPVYDQDTVGDAIVYDFQAWQNRRHGNRGGAA